MYWKLCILVATSNLYIIRRGIIWKEEVGRGVREGGRGVGKREGSGGKRESIPNEEELFLDCLGQLCCHAHVHSLLHHHH